LPEPPERLVQIARSRQARDVQRRELELERGERDRDNRIMRLRCQGARNSEVAGLAGQLEDWHAEKVAGLEAIRALDSRGLVREYVPEAGWEGWARGQPGLRDQARLTAGLTQFG
jgi:hypothetical protein